MLLGGIKVYRIRNSKSEKIKQFLEDIIENYNAYIQVIFFILIISVTLFGNSFNIDQQSVIVSLLTIVAMQFLVQGVKDSIAQKKLNNIMAIINIEVGRLFRVDDLKLDRFFAKTKRDFFISGIALNGFFDKYKESITDLLKKRKKVYVLIAAPDVVEENTKLYYGITDNNLKYEEKIKDVLNKQRLTLNILKMYGISKYLEEEKFYLRISNTVFSTSFVAYDIMNNVKKSKKESQEIKASFYQYSCTEPKYEPNICIDNTFSREWYSFFEKTLKMQWKDAEPVNTQEDFEKLCKMVDDLWKEHDER